MLVVVIPVYNEGERAIKTVNNVLSVITENIIVVDDGSNDGTYNMLKKTYANNSRITLLRHLINLGKGSAMKTGAETAWKLGANAVIFMDADGQHNPKYLNKFKKLLKNNDIVFGYRLMDKNMPTIRKLGNIIASLLVKILFGIKKRDLLSGYLGFSKTVYEKIKWDSRRYGIETEMAARIGRKRIPFKEIKVDTIYIDKYKGVTILDALKILIKIPLWYFEA